MRRRSREPSASVHESANRLCSATRRRPTTAKDDRAKLALGSLHMTNDRSQMTNCAGAKSRIDQQHLSSVICYLLSETSLRRVSMGGRNGDILGGHSG